MAKNYFLITDTETTQDQKVADFGAVLVNTKGEILNECGVLVDGIFTDKENHPLFFDSSAPADALWSRSGADKRYVTYNEMVKNGSRMLASVAAVNRWLARINEKYSPALTAYNLAFDADKCRKTGIDLDMFSKRFCLWQAAYTQFAKSKAYKNAVLSLHAFNPPTKHGNMTYKTNAETMARFCLDNMALEDEPHTALEDAKFYELPILKAILKKRSAKWLLTEPVSYSWRDCQVKDNFSA